MSEEQIELNSGTFWRPIVSSVNSITDIRRRLVVKDVTEWTQYLREKEDEEEARIRLEEGGGG